MEDDSANKDYPLGYDYRASARYFFYGRYSNVKLTNLQSRPPTLLDKAANRSFTASRYQFT